MGSKAGSSSIWNCPIRANTIQRLFIAISFELNSYLSEEIVRSSSLTQSKEKAESLGYLQPEKILYVKGDDFLAKLP